MCSIFITNLIVVAMTLVNVQIDLWASFGDLGCNKAARKGRGLGTRQAGSTLGVGVSSQLSS